MENRPSRSIYHYQNCPREYTPPIRLDEWSMFNGSLRNTNNFIVYKIPTEDIDQPQPGSGDNLYKAPKELQETLQATFSNSSEMFFRSKSVTSSKNCNCKRTQPIENKIITSSLEESENTCCPLSCFLKSYTKPNVPMKVNSSDKFDVLASSSDPSKIYKISQPRCLSAYGSCFVKELKSSSTASYGPRSPRFALLEIFKTYSYRAKSKNRYCRLKRIRSQSQHYWQSKLSILQYRQFLKVYPVLCKTRHENKNKYPALRLFSNYFTVLKLLSRKYNIDSSSTFQGSSYPPNLPYIITSPIRKCAKIKCIYRKYHNKNIKYRKGRQVHSSSLLHSKFLLIDKPKSKFSQLRDHFFGSMDKFSYKIRRRGDNTSGNNRGYRCYNNSMQQGCSTPQQQHSLHSQPSQNSWLTQTSENGIRRNQCNNITLSSTGFVKGCNNNRPTGFCKQFYNRRCSNQQTPSFCPNLFDKRQIRQCTEIPWRTPPCNKEPFRRKAVQTYCQTATIYRDVSKPSRSEVATKDIQTSQGDLRNKNRSNVSRTTQKSQMPREEDYQMTQEDDLSNQHSPRSSRKQTLDTLAEDQEYASLNTNNVASQRSNTEIEAASQRNQKSVSARDGNFEKSNTNYVERCCEPTCTGSQRNRNYANRMQKSHSNFERGNTDFVESDPAYSGLERNQKSNTAVQKSNVNFFENYSQKYSEPPYATSQINQKSDAGMQKSFVRSNANFEKSNTDFVESEPPYATSQINQKSGTGMQKSFVRSNANFEKSNTDFVERCCEPNCTGSQRNQKSGVQKSNTNYQSFAHKSRISDEDEQVPFEFSQHTYSQRGRSEARLGEDGMMNDERVSFEPPQHRYSEGVSKISQRGRRSEAVSIREDGMMNDEQMPFQAPQHRYSEGVSKISQRSRRSEAVSVREDGMMTDEEVPFQAPQHRYSEGVSKISQRDRRSEAASVREDDMMYDEPELQNRYSTKSHREQFDEDASMHGHDVMNDEPAHSYGSTDERSYWSNTSMLKNQGFVERRCCCDSDCTGFQRPLEEEESQPKGCCGSKKKKQPENKSETIKAKSQTRVVESNKSQIIEDSNRPNPSRITFANDRTERRYCCEEGCLGLQRPVEERKKKGGCIIL